MRARGALVDFFVQGDPCLAYFADRFQWRRLREITFDISAHVKIPCVMTTCLWLNVAPHNLSWLEEPGTAHTVPGNLQTPQRAVPPVHDGAYFRTLILRNGAPTGRDVSKSVAGRPATCLSNVSRALSRPSVDATDMLSDQRAAGPTHVDRTRAPVPTCSRRYLGVALQIETLSDSRGACLARTLS